MRRCSAARSLQRHWHSADCQFAKKACTGVANIGGLLRMFNSGQSPNSGSVTYDTLRRPAEKSSGPGTMPSYPSVFPARHCAQPAEISCTATKLQGFLMEVAS